MSNLFLLECVSVKGVIFSEKVISLYSTSVDMGDFQILQGYEMGANFLIKEGLSFIMTKDEEKKIVVIDSYNAVLHVNSIQKNKCSMLSDRMYIIDTNMVDEIINHIQLKHVKLLLKNLL